MIVLIQYWNKLSWVWYKMRIYGLKHLKNYVVKDRDYRKVALAILGLGVFGLFFSVVLFPQIGLHVFKWVSVFTWTRPCFQYIFSVRCHSWISAISTNTAKSVAQNVHRHSVSNDIQNLFVQCSQQARSPVGRKAQFARDRTIYFSVSLWIIPRVLSEYFNAFINGYCFLESNSQWVLLQVQHIGRHTKWYNGFHIAENMDFSTAAQWWINWRWKYYNTPSRFFTSFQ